MAKLQNTDLVPRDAFGDPIKPKTTDPTVTDGLSVKTPIMTGFLPPPPVAPTLSSTKPTGTAPTPAPTVTSVLPPPPITAQPVSLTPPPVTLPATGITQPSPVSAPAPVPITAAPGPLAPPPVTLPGPVDWYDNPVVPSTLPTTKPTGIAGAPTAVPVSLPMPVTLPALPPAPLGDASTTPPLVVGPSGVPPALPPPPTADGANVPGAVVAPFGPGQDLRYDSILPTAVDRLGLAKDYFDQYAESTNPAYEQTLRAATQRAAANGILGSGMLTNTYGDVATQRAQALDLARRGFLTDALSGTIADNAANRDELRTERGYQDQTAQQAIQDQITQLLLQSQLGNTSFNQQLSLAQLLGQLGYAGNPDEALLSASSQQQQTADQTYQQIAQLLAAYGQRQAVG